MNVDRGLIDRALPYLKQVPDIAFAPDVKRIIKSPEFSGLGGEIRKGRERIAWVPPAGTHLYFLTSFEPARDRRYSFDTTEIKWDRFNSDITVRFFLLGRDVEWQIIKTARMRRRRTQEFSLLTDPPLADGVIMKVLHQRALGILSWLTHQVYISMNPYMVKPTLDKNIEVPLNTLKDLLTDSELRMLKQRFLILNLLEEGYSIRSIASQVGVGTDTVVRTARLAERRGLLIAIRPSKKRAVKHLKASKTPWVFGKSE